jgi:DNA-binding NarL/FixJ family response regulator
VAQKIVGEFTRLKEQHKSIIYVFNIMSSLTNSEFEILCLFFNGSNSRDIAKTRFVSSTTIKSQVSSILHKFKMKNMKEVVQLLKQMKFDDFMNEHLL